MPRLPIDFGNELADEAALRDYSSRLPVELPTQALGQNAANAVNNLFAPVGDVPRYQLWPEVMLRSGATLPSDVVAGRIPMSLGLRREDFTDIPIGSHEPTKDSTWLGKKLGMSPVFAEPGSDELIGRTQDISGMAGGGAIASKPNASLGSGPVRKPSLAGNEELSYLLKPKSKVDIIGKESGTIEPNGISELKVTNSPEGYAAHRLVYSEDGKIVGVMQITKVPNSDSYKVANTYVDPEFRRQGIATKLNDKAKELFGNVESSELEASPAGQAFRTSVLRSDTSETAPIAALAKQNAPVFYSAVEKAVKDAKLTKGDADQWLGYIRNQPGVKQEELDWVLHELPKGQISKPELEQFIKDHKVELKEVNLGKNEATSNWSAPIDWFRPVVMEIKTLEDVALARKHNHQFKETFKSWSDDELWKDIQEYKKLPYTEFAGPSKYSQWQLPGGKSGSYKEMLLTLPRKGIGSPEAYSKIQKYRSELTEKYGEEWDKKLDSKEDAKLFDLQKDYDSTFNNPEFKSSHWNEPNVLAHIRTNEREIPSVGKSLHIEEIQSDWHQKGRKEGYKGELNKLRPEFDKIEKRIMDSNDESILADPELKNALKTAVDKKLITTDEAKLYKRYVDISPSGSRGGVPNAPFKKGTSWADLALKRIIRQAAEEGKDAISWTPGEAQAARYDLSKHIQKVSYDGQRLWAWKHGDDHSPVINEKVEANKLADYIGKDAAEKLLQQPKVLPSEFAGPSSRSYQTLKGLDLKVGGEGMHAFYDKMLVDKANVIAKKFGGKVEKAEITTDKKKLSDYSDTELDAGKNVENKQSIHVLKITPELRDAALNKGFSLFADTGKVGAPLAALTKVEGNPFKAEAFHGSPHPLRGTKIENPGRYEVRYYPDKDMSDKYQVYDRGLSKYISEPFGTKEAAKDWLDKRVGTEFYSTPNPKLAEDYASQNRNAKGVNITPLRIDISDYHNVNAMGKTWDAVNTTAIREAEQLGKKGIVIKNVLDDADPRTSRGPQTVYITLDPSTVRSKFAKFDPKHFGESGLLKAGSLPLITDKDGNQLDKNLKPMFTSNGRVKLIPVKENPFKGEK